MPVKPLSPTHVFAASIVTGLGLLLFWSSYPDDHRPIDHFGNSMAESLASQVVGPFEARDLIHLSVLTNRMIELPEIAGAAVYTVDDALVTLSGDVVKAKPYTRPVVQDDAIVGYVRVHVDEAAFRQPVGPGMLLISLLWMALIPVAVIFADRLTGSWPPARRRDPREIGPVPEPSPDCLTAVSAVAPDCLITVNLFNQLSLTRDQCQRELDLARRTARAVAELYHAEVEDLPGTGLVLVMHPTGSDDRPFHVICAAFALCRLFEQMESWGRYRFGVHIRNSDVAAPEDHNAIADAAVLSALARDNAVIISAALFEKLSYPQRVVSDVLNHPLLDELTTIGGRAHLAWKLADPHQHLVDQQVRELRYSGRSTARESTF